MPIRCKGLIREVPIPLIMLFIVLTYLTPLPLTQ
jgi:hypothetical protein